MNRRIIGWGLLVLLMIGGLVAGYFAPGIERSLTVSAAQSKGVSATMGTPGALPTRSAATPTAAATAPPVATVPAGSLAFDTFQRANQTLWGTAFDTQAWSGDANTNAAVFSIVNGAGQIANGQGTFNALLGRPGTNLDVVASGVVNHFIGDSNKVNFGLVLRWTDGNNWYKALLDGAHLIVVKRVNGASTQLMMMPFQALDGQAYSIHFRALGAMLFARAWLSRAPEPTKWQITTNDTDLTTGLGGVRVLVQNTTIVRVASFLETMAVSDV